LQQGDKIFVRQPDSVLGFAHVEKHQVELDFALPNLGVITLQLNEVMRGISQFARYGRPGKNVGVNQATFKDAACRQRYRAFFERLRGWRKGLTDQEFQAVAFVGVAKLATPLGAGGIER
jgi:hypothetical protein